ncbi:hypothetical protein B0H13DRAFT_1852026 [Mycena leptocephala]|nr:hypothetical protein B0H13DRAFT_1852026 [Mycena leptocephala]
MNDLPTLHRVGWNHADVCHQPPRSLPGKPPKDIQLTLSLVVQVGYALNSEDIESKVYTPMDVDDPTFYNPVNVDEPRVYTPMDVDETCELVLHFCTTWGDCLEQILPRHILRQFNGQLNGRKSASSEHFRCVKVIGKLGFRCKLCKHLSGTYRLPDEKSLVDLQSELPPPSNSGQHLVQREWESWDSGTLADQKLMYRKKWEIMRRNKQPLFPFQFRHIPWPIFRSGEKYPEINTPSVEYFIFGETRGKPPTKESKRLVKENLKLFHSDKFALVLGRVLPVDREWARHCAEAVCRVLTRHLN